MNSHFLKIMRSIICLVFFFISASPIYAAKSDKLDMQMVLDLNKNNGLVEIVEGKDNAPVVIVEYASLTCPHCADFYLNVLPQIREKYIKTGKVRFIFRELAWDPYALAGSVIARCVSPIRYEGVVRAFFSNQSEWLLGTADHARDYIFQVGKNAGLTQDQITACLENKKIINAIDNNFKLAHDKLGIDGTPAFIINGAKHVGDMSFKQISMMIDAALASAK